MGYPTLTIWDYRHHPELIAAFEAHISPEPNSGCWLWTGHAVGSGRAVGRTPEKYGFFQWGTLAINAHRCAYELWVGQIPPRMLVRHKCDVGLCVNPQHLCIGTHQDNMDDMKARGRHRNGPRPTGSQQHNAILTEGDIPTIRALRSGGMTYTEIGVRYGVSKATIRMVCLGRAWKHVP